MEERKNLIAKNLELNIRRGMRKYLDFIAENGNSIAEYDIAEFRNTCSEFIGQLGYIEGCMRDNSLLDNKDIDFTKYSNKSDVNGVVADIIKFIETNKQSLESIFLSEYGIDIVRCIRARSFSENIIQAINAYDYLRKDNRYEKFLKLITNHFIVVDELCKDLRNGLDYRLDELALRCKKSEKYLGI